MKLSWSNKQMQKTCHNHTSQNRHIFELSFACITYFNPSMWLQQIHHPPPRSPTSSFLLLSSPLIRFFFFRSAWSSSQLLISSSFKHFAYVSPRWSTACKIFFKNWGEIARFMWIHVWLHMEVCINVCHLKISVNLLEIPSHVKQTNSCDTVWVTAQGWFEKFRSLSGWFQRRLKTFSRYSSGPISCCGCQALCTATNISSLDFQMRCVKATVWAKGSNMQCGQLHWDWFFVWGILLWTNQRRFVVQRKL